MQSNKSYQVRLESSTSQKFFPKKYMQPIKVPIKRDNKGNTALDSTMTVWIPDTPYSSYPPNVALVINVANSKTRLYFETVDDLMNWIDQLAQFLEGQAGQIKKALDEATRQWHETQEVIQKIREDRLQSGNHGDKANEGDS